MTELEKKLMDIIERIKKVHPHDSMSMDYYGIPCKICEILKEVENK